MVHVPAPTSVTVLPLTVQTVEVLDVNVTAAPADDVAARENAASERLLAPSEPKEIVCTPAPITATGVPVLAVVEPFPNCESAPRPQQ